MSHYDATCIICGHMQDVDTYGEHVCDDCGQEYEYEECHRIILTPAQIAVLRGAHCHSCAHRLLDPDNAMGEWKCTCPKIGERCYIGDDEDDALTYSYDEGGWFIPGPMFGCIHHKATS